MYGRYQREVGMVFSWLGLIRDTQIRPREPLDILGIPIRHSPSPVFPTQGWVWAAARWYSRWDLGYSSAPPSRYTDSRPPPHGYHSSLLQSPPQSQTHSFHSLHHHHLQPHTLPHQQSYLPGAASWWAVAGAGAVWSGSGCWWPVVVPGSSRWSGCCYHPGAWNSWWLGCYGVS